jgi:hypothetical protein
MSRMIFALLLTQSGHLPVPLTMLLREWRYPRTAASVMAHFLFLRDDNAPTANAL